MACCLPPVSSSGHDQVTDVWSHPPAEDGLIPPRTTLPRLETSIAPHDGHVVAFSSSSSAGRTVALPKAVPKKTVARRRRSLHRNFIGSPLGEPVKAMGRHSLLMQSGSTTASCPSLPDMQANLRGNPSAAARIGRILDKQLVSIEGRLSVVQRQQRDVMSKRLGPTRWTGQTLALESRSSVGKEELSLNEVELSLISTSSELPSGLAQSLVLTSVDAAPAGHDAAASEHGDASAAHLPSRDDDEKEAPLALEPAPSSAELAPTSAGEMELEQEVEPMCDDVMPEDKSAEEANEGILDTALGGGEDPDVAPSEGIAEMAKTEKDEPDTSELEETVEATLETSPLPHAPLDEVTTDEGVEVVQTANANSEENETSSLLDLQGDMGVSGPAADTENVPAAKEELDAIEQLEPSPLELGTDAPVLEQKQEQETDMQVDRACERAVDAEITRNESGALWMATTFSSESFHTHLAEGMVTNLVDESICLLATTTYNHERASTIEALDSSRASTRPESPWTEMPQMSPRAMLERASCAASAVPQVEPLGEQVGASSAPTPEEVGKWMLRFYSRVVSQYGVPEVAVQPQLEPTSDESKMSGSGRDSRVSISAVAADAPAESDNVITPAHDAAGDQEEEEDATDLELVLPMRVTIQGAAEDQGDDSTRSAPMAPEKSKLLAAIEEARPSIHSTFEPDEVIAPFKSILEVVEATTEDFMAAAVNVAGVLRFKTGEPRITSQSMLWRALRMLGVRYTDSKIGEEVLQEAKASAVDFDESDFAKFADSYRERLKQRCLELFAAADEDNSNTVSLAELSIILRSMNIMYLPGVVEDHMRNFAGGLHAGVSFTQFMRMYEVLGPTRGFRTAEYQRIMGFCRHGSGGQDGKSSCNRVGLFLEWFGAHGPVVEEILAKVPEVASEDDFLEAACQFREKEAALVQSAFSDADVDMSGVVTTAMLPGIIDVLGYEMLLPEVIDEIVEPSQQRNEAGWLFEEVCAVVHKFQAQHGLPQSELDEIRETYAKHSKENRGFMSCNEMVSALHWLGFTATVEEIQAMFETIDTEDNDYIGEQEFVVAATRCYLRDHLAAKEAFVTSDLNKDGFLTQHEVRMALLHFKHMPKAQRMSVAKSEATADIRMDLNEFVHLVTKHRQESRRNIHNSQGFNEKEVARFKTQFQRYCTDEACKEVMSAEGKQAFIADLSQKIYHNLGQDDVSHHEAKCIMQVADPEETGKIDFRKFLVVMRVLDDLQVMDRVRREKLAVRSMGISPKELSELRKLFHQFDDDNSQELAPAEVEAMISRIVPLDYEGTRELAAHLQAVDALTDGELDFPEFLNLVKRLQDSNWHGINEICAPRGSISNPQAA